MKSITVLLLIQQYSYDLKIHFTVFSFSSLYNSVCNSFIILLVTSNIITASKKQQIFDKYRLFNNTCVNL